MAQAEVEPWEIELRHRRSELERQEERFKRYETEAEGMKAKIDEAKAKRDALLGDLEKAQAAYD